MSCFADHHKRESVMFFTPSTADVTLRRSRSTRLQASISQLVIKISPRKSQDDNNLRPCQQNYMAARSAKRRLGRSADRKTVPHDEPIFTEHAAHTKKYAVSATASMASIAPSRQHSVSIGDKGRTLPHAENHERNVLLRSINSIRTSEGVEPLQLDKQLSECLAGLLSCHEAHFTANENRHPVSPMPPTSIHSTGSSTGGHQVRLTSPPGLGALACGELWYGGKYKRCSPESSNELNAQHSDKCACNGRKVFETLVAAEWNTVGIARSIDGRWAVEFAGEKRALNALEDHAVGTSVKVQHPRPQTSSMMLDLEEIVEPDAEHEGRRSSWETVFSMYSRA